MGRKKFSFFLPEHRPSPFVTVGGLLPPFTKLKRPVFLMEDNKSFMLASLLAPLHICTDRWRLSFALPCNGSGTLQCRR
jgi:hypothetical protein